MKKILGIIGGMGPAATCDLIQKIISLTRAKSDQEHIHIIADFNTSIPDRTAAILQNGPSPVPELLISAKRLESAGADILLMPCNTAHYYYPQIVQAVRIPVLNMPKETASALADIGVKKAGILATDGTIQANVYGNALLEAGVAPVYPSPAMQAEVMRLIYEGIKAQSVPLNSIPVDAIIRDLTSQGAEKFVLACTELPIAFQALDKMTNCLDATHVLALAAVKSAGYPINESSS